MMLRQAIKVAGLLKRVQPLAVTPVRGLVKHAPQKSGYVVKHGPQKDPLTMIVVSLGMVGFGLLTPMAWFLIIYFLG